MKSLKQKTMSSKQFTLAELLIVLGISGVTFLMLALSIQEPRGPCPRPPRVSCLNNVRQMGLVLAMYANDHRNVKPTGSTSGAVFERLYGEGYLENLQILSCPANTVENIDFDSPYGALLIGEAGFDHWGRAAVNHCDV